MNYFKLEEFLPDEIFEHPQIKERNIIEKIAHWNSELNKVRSLVGFPIKVTDCVRIGNGTSQHYFNGSGAVDLRPTLIGGNNFLYLLLALYSNPNFNRICYYPPGELFQFGGFHIDKKYSGKHLFVSDKDTVKWERIDLQSLVDLLD